MKKALIVIDVQNDYFANGAFEQANAETVCANIVAQIRTAKADGDLVVLVQHIFDDVNAPLFAKDSRGAQLHQDILAVASDCPVVIKAHANSFLNTTLESVLAEFAITHLQLCGMMTQNCVTHTAIAKEAEKYTVSVLGDACAAPTQMVHQIALAALADRVAVI